MSVPGVVLAGGLATRMGGDKAFAPLGGRPLLAHAVGRLGRQCAPLAISWNGDPARLAGFGLPVLADGEPGRPGPLAGVLAAMDWGFSLGAERVATVAGDTPFLPANLVARLAAAGGFALASAGRVHPTCGLWPVGLREALRADLRAGVRRVRDWAFTRGAVAVEFPDPDAFFNVNTPADLAEAARRLEGGE